MVQTAEVARQLGLPGSDPDAVRIASNKADQRRPWAECGAAGHRDAHGPKSAASNVR